MQSIVLDPVTKDMIMEDAKDFMGSEGWYAERGETPFLNFAFHPLDLLLTM